MENPSIPTAELQYRGASAYVRILHNTEYSALADNTFVHLTIFAMHF